MRFCLGYALHPVHAGFVFHPSEHTLAGDIGDNFLVAARGAFARGEHRDLPAVPVGEALIHAVEIAGKKRCFVAARPGTHLENGALLVGIVLRQELDLELMFEILDFRPEPAGFLLRQQFHVGVGAAVIENLLKPVILLLRLAQRIDRSDDRIEIGEFL